MTLSLWIRCQLIAGLSTEARRTCLGIQTLLLKCLNPVSQRQVSQRTLSRFGVLFWRTHFTSFVKKLAAGSDTSGFYWVCHVDGIMVLDWMLLLVSKAFHMYHDAMEQFPPLDNLKALLKSQGKYCKSLIIADHCST